MRIIVLLVILVSISGCSMWPPYAAWEQEWAGKAELAKADYSKQILVQEAKAKEDAAKYLASAEIERAKGVAEANKIIGGSLKGNEDYLRYLWIHNLAEHQGDVIYVPTEAGLPILEAGKRIPHAK